MKKWMFTCSMGHEAKTWEVMADTKEDAAKQLMGMDELKNHVSEMHADMASKSEEEMMDMMMNGLTEMEG